MNTDDENMVCTFISGQSGKPEEQPSTPPNVEPVDLQKLAEETLSKLCIVDSDVATGSELKSIILTALQQVAASYGAEIERLKRERDGALLEAKDGLPFIERLLGELSERAGLPTGDWDSEDDPAEVIASHVADALTAANQKIEELKSALAAKGEK